jgi:hypothetical protein
MRFVQRDTITSDELKYSEIDLISRSRVSVAKDVGMTMFDNYPELVTATQHSGGDVLVEMDVVVFKTEDFHKMINKLYEVLDEKTFDQVKIAMNLEETNE